ncbi:MAG: biotin/lipoyl-binding protein, partial [Desulfobacterales bacterium]
MKKRLRIVIPIVLMVGALLIWHFRFRPQGPVSHIRVSGNIEVTQVEVSFKIPGRLAQRMVDEGDHVQAGQVIARLDPEDQRLKVAQAEAELAYA